MASCLKCVLIATLLTTILLCNLSLMVDGKRTETIRVPGRRCSRTQAKETDGARLMSSGLSANDGCVTLEADEEKFVIIYEAASLSCGQTLKLYYSRSLPRVPDVKIDCHTSFRSLGTDFSRSKYLSVFFDAGRNINAPYNFSLVVTSFKDELGCLGQDEHYCSYLSEDICVDSDVMCDGVINCPDGGDEDESLCHIIDVVEGAQHVTIGVVIAVIVVIILTCVGCIVGIYCCCKRQRANRGRVIRGPAQTVNVQQPPPAAAPAPYYPTGPQAPPPAGGYPPQHPPPGAYPQAGPPPGTYPQASPPPGTYPQAGPPPGTYPQAGPPPGGYQPVPTAPPAAEAAYPPPAYPAAQGPPPPAYPGNEPVQYSAQPADVKVPM